MKLYESGATLAVNMGVFVAKMRDSIEAHIQASLKTAQDPDGGPFPAYLSHVLGQNFWKDGLREEVLSQRLFGSRFRSTAFGDFERATAHGLYHGRFRL